MGTGTGGEGCLFFRVRAEDSLQVIGQGEDTGAGELK